MFFLISHTNEILKYLQTKFKSQLLCNLILTAKCILYLLVNYRCTICQETRDTIIKVNLKSTQKSKCIS